MKKPKIILVTGTAGVGKTTLANSLSRKYNISTIIGTDYLREILRIKNTNIALHKSVTKSSIKEFAFVCDLIHPLIKTIIKRSVLENKSIIIEGIHIKLNAFSKCKKYMLIINDEELHKLNLKKREQKDNRPIKKYFDNWKRIRRLQTFLKSQADKNDFYIMDLKLNYNNKKIKFYCPSCSKKQLIEPKLNYWYCLKCDYSSDKFTGGV